MCPRRHDLLLLARRKSYSRHAVRTSRVAVDGVAVDQEKVADQSPVLVGVLVATAELGVSYMQPETREQGTYKAVIA